MSHKKKIDIDPLNPIVNIKGQLFTEGLTQTAVLHNQWALCIYYKRLFSLIIFIKCPSTGRFWTFW